jgi:branched-chain amino acid transport system permease protein
MARLRLRNLNMTLRYEDDLKLFKSRQSKLAILVLLVVAVLFPLSYKGDFWLSVLNYAGIAAVGAIGLNLLTGYTGQVSLGHAFFLGIGAYSAVFFGGTHGWPLPLWLLACAVVGGVVGLVVGPFALRLRGNYLAVVSLGLVFLGIHIFTNWDSVTGGPGGTGVTPPLTLGPVNFAKLELGNQVYSRNQGFFLLVWVVVAIAALLAKNIARTRPGRAMQAVRDRDVAAEVIGVSLARYKVGAFVISSALAAVAGGLFGAYQQFVTPDSWNLFLSIQYIAIIIVGGVGTIFGSILGALFVGAVPQVVDRFSGHLPFVSKTTASASGFHLTVYQLNQMIFGALIVLFLVVEPRGLAAVWLRIKAYFKAWPFSY